MIFTTAVGSPLTKELIEEAIKWNEEMRSDYDKYEDYYKGEHEIFKRNKIKGRGLSNHQLMINHCRYITDTKIGYLLGKAVAYSTTDEVNDLELLTDEYKAQMIADLDHEIAKKLSIFGRQYELVFLDENNVRSKDVDVRNCVVIYDDTVQHKKMYAIIYKLKDTDTNKKQTFEGLFVYDDEKVWDCSDSDGNIIVAENLSNDHKFTQIPVIEYKNDSEYQGDFLQIISLQDAYNLLQSDRVNDKEQLVEALLIFYNIKLEKNQLKQLVDEKVVSDIPYDSKVEYLIKNLDEVQADILRKTIADDIHKISMTPDLSDENFTGNSSGVAIAYKLLGFEQSIINKERYLKKGLFERFGIYNGYLNKSVKMPLVALHEVEINFTRNLPLNDLEISQMINNLRGILPDDTLTERLSFIDNASDEVERAKEESNERFSKRSEMFGKNEPNKKEEEEEDENSKE